MRNEYALASCQSTQFYTLELAVFGIFPTSRSKKLLNSSRAKGCSSMVLYKGFCARASGLTPKVTLARQRTHRIVENFEIAGRFLDALAHGQGGLKDCLIHPAVSKRFGTLLWIAGADAIESEASSDMPSGGCCRLSTWVWGRLGRLRLGG